MLRQVLVHGAPLTRFFSQASRSYHQGPEARRRQRSTEHQTSCCGVTSLPDSSVKLRREEGQRQERSHRSECDGEGHARGHTHELSQLLKLLRTCQSPDDPHHKQLYLRAWGLRKVIFRIDGESAIRPLGVAIQDARSEETVIECRPIRRVDLVQVAKDCRSHETRRQLAHCDLVGKVRSKR